MPDEIAPLQNNICRNSPALPYTVVYYASSMAATVEGGKNVCAVLRAKGDLQLVSQHLCLSF